MQLYSCTETSLYTIDTIVISYFLYLLRFPFSLGMAGGMVFEFFPREPFSCLDVSSSFTILLIWDRNALLSLPLPRTAAPFLGLLPTFESRPFFLLFREAGFSVFFSSCKLLADFSNSFFSSYNLCKNYSIGDIIFYHVR